jgi:hypothetical protein
MNNRLSICHRENCIHAQGDYAESIAVGVIAMLLLIGVAAVAKSFN